MTKTEKTSRRWAEIRFHKAKALCFRSVEISLGDKNFLKSVAQVAVMSPASAGDKPDVAEVVTPCTPKAASREHHLRKDRLSCKIYFRVTKPEYEKKHAEAASYGISLSDWARAAFLKHSLPIPRPTACAIREVLVEFCRVSNNLNQLAHKANCGESVGNDVAIIKSSLLPIIRRFHQIEGFDP